VEEPQGLVKLKFDRFAQLTAEKATLKDRLEVLQQELDALDNELRLEFFEPHGLLSFRTSAGTFSVRTDLYVGVAEGTDREELAELLTGAEEWSVYVRPQYNANSLAAAVRERLRELENALGDDYLALSDEKKLELVFGESIAPHVKLNPKRSVRLTKK
jgi:hypothetical protein